MTTPALTPQTDWYRASLALLSGTLEKQEEPFYRAINTLYTYVAEKSNGRNCSKKIHDQLKRDSMVAKLFEQYVKDVPVYELCKSSFMRKLVKHNQNNDPYLKFIYQEMVPHLLSQSSESKKLQEDPAVLLWLRELSATIYEPAALQEQSELYFSIPDPTYRQNLTKERMVIGKELKESALKGWIDGETIDQIREALLQKVETNQAVELTKETTVAYFVYRYRELIASGHQYAELFCQAIHMGLGRFKVRELEIIRKSI